MLNGMIDILKAYWIIISAGFTLAIAFIVYRRNVEEISYRLMNWWYGLPLIGRLARLSGDLTRSNRPGWLKAEQTLCADYRKHVMPVSRATFENYHQYLKKAHDHGGRPLPVWMWLFLGVLIIAEGLGFSYLLGAQMALEGSENVRTTLMVAIVLVISGILLWVTHAAGHQLHRTGLLRSCFKQWKGSGSERSLSARTISLADDQSIDDGDPEYSQCVSRVKASPMDRGSYVLVWVAVIAITSIAIGSTWLRFSHFAASRVESTVSATSDPFGQADPQADALPTAVTAPQEAADAKAKADGETASKSEAMAAFITLGFIFAITQIVGIGAGYRYGFSAKQSYQAWRKTRGYADYQDYLSHFEERAQTAEARLQQLQQRLGEHHHDHVPVGKKFEDYLVETAHTGVEAFAMASSRGGSVAAKNGERATPAPTATTANGVPDGLSDVVARIDAAGTREGKLAVLEGLSEADAEAVHAHLRERKHARSEAVEQRFGDVL